MIEIDPVDLQMVHEILHARIPEYRVGVFGSRINGKARKSSDLDLVVFSEAPLATSTLSALHNDFSESRLPFRVDIVDWATTSQEFRAVIEDGYEIVQEGSV